MPISGMRSGALSHRHVSEAAATASVQIIRSGAALPDWGVAVGAHPEGSTGRAGPCGVRGWTSGIGARRIGLCR